MAILRTKAQALGVDIDTPLAEYLARRASNNVRQLEGALNRLSAYCSFTESAPTLETAQRALADLFTTPTQTTTTPERILELVSSHFSVSKEDLVGRKRDRITVSARQVAMYLLREELALSYSLIGRLFGNRDHSTVTHSVGKIAHAVDSGDPLHQHVSSLKASLDSHPPV
jgi:chromosomal replication initiator protein